MTPQSSAFLCVRDDPRVSAQVAGCAHLAVRTVGRLARATPSRASRTVGIGVVREDGEDLGDGDKGEPGSSTQVEQIRVVDRQRYERGVLPFVEGTSSRAYVL